jgi:hypothetical protein
MAAPRKDLGGDLYKPSENPSPHSQLKIAPTSACVECSSLAAERLHGIDPRGTPRRHQRREHGDGKQTHGDDREHRCIVQIVLERERLQPARRELREQKTESDSAEYEGVSFAENRAQHVRARRPERDANAQLTLSLGDRVRDDAIRPERGKPDRDKRKEAEDGHHKPQTLSHAANALCH